MNPRQAPRTISGAPVMAAARAEGEGSERPPAMAVPPKPRRAMRSGRR